jgi:hypothetical protein
VVADVRLVLILGLESLALCMNFGAGHDRLVLSGMGFGDLKLDGANLGVDGEGVQLAN